MFCFALSPPMGETTMSVTERSFQFVTQVEERTVVVNGLAFSWREGVCVSWSNTN